MEQRKNPRAHSGAAQIANRTAPAINLDQHTRRSLNNFATSCIVVRDCPSGRDATDAKRLTRSQRRALRVSIAHVVICHHAVF